MFEEWKVDPDFQLVWPRTVFVAEAREMLRRYGPDDEHLVRVFEEAFHGDGPADALRMGATTLLGLQPSDADPWTTNSATSRAARALDSLSSRKAAASFLDDAESLREFSRPRPYWGSAEALERKQLGPEGLRNAWERLLMQFESNGYLAKVAPPICVDDDFIQTDPLEILERELDERLGRENLWPLRNITEWERDTFYAVVEVFHDLVARPRRRHFHNFSRCGWHYYEFNVGTGQALYRAQVNRLFAQYGVGLSIAEGGEDLGRLVTSPEDPRALLVRRVLRKTHDVDTKKHAIALFRHRGATREEKRSACVALGGLLEQSRDQIKRDLLRGDEGALFEILNKFALRHRRADQHSEYDEAYLDWIFWWLLATVELLDRLRLRGA